MNITVTLTEDQAQYVGNLLAQDVDRRGIAASYLAGTTAHAIQIAAHEAQKKKESKDGNTKCGD